MGTMDADTASGCSEVLQALKRRNYHECQSGTELKILHAD